MRGDGVTPFLVDDEVMNGDNLAQRTGEGRTMSVLAYGDNAAELEMYALDEARKFFGTELRLEIVQDYKVVTAGETDASGGKRYRAGLIIRERA